MEKSRLIIVASSVCLMLIWMLSVSPRQILAQDSNHVAVVVRLDDEDVISRCVAFDEEQISGYDALRRSGLDVIAGFDAQGGSMCKIDGTGCPADNCFCQCKGGQDCVYWSYWHQVGDSWEYARVGATSYKVSDKQVEGWSWGPGTISKAVEPPLVTFEAVCSSLESSEVAAPTEESALPGGWLQYALFGGILTLLALALVYSQIRSKRE